MDAIDNGFEQGEKVGQWYWENYKNKWEAHPLSNITPADYTNKGRKEFKIWANASKFTNCNQVVLSTILNGCNCSMYQF